jgi:DNA-binding transcriptional MerR regulator
VHGRERRLARPLLPEVDQEAGRGFEESGGPTNPEKLLTLESIPGFTLSVMPATRAGYRSGELAAKAGVSADTLRHYERRGLIAAVERLPNGYRSYRVEALDRVLLIQRALSVGFSLDELARLLRARERGHPPCREVRALAARKLEEVEQQLQSLTDFRAALQTTLRDWDARLDRRRGEEPARLLDSLVAGRRKDIPLSSPLTGVRFDRRKGRQEKR